MSTVNSEAGYSLTEVLVSTALGGIILAGVFDLYISSSNSIRGQTNAVQMQTDAKAALDYMAKELRLMNGPPTIGANSDTITFLRVMDSGYSSGGNTLSTLWDTSKSWLPNIYAPTAEGSYSIKIITGSGVGEIHPLKGNTATMLTLADTDTWPPMAIPDVTSLYFIFRNKTFTLLPDQTLRYQQVTGGPLKLLAPNITDLAFSPNTSDNYATDITLTARTQDKDPRTGNYGQYTITATAQRRN